VLRMLLYGLATVGIMLYRPRGLWPAPEHGVQPMFGGARAAAPGAAEAASRNG
jgi:branched-chain amino acid transport system permease protein